MPYKKETVMHFIDRFTDNGRNQAVIDTFAKGCCYWFAEILRQRFPSGQIVYDPVENHFACRISGKTYDVTGETDDHYRFVSWADYPDATEKRRIIRQCINW